MELIELLNKYNEQLANFYHQVEINKDGYFLVWYLIENGIVNYSTREIEIERASLKEIVRYLEQYT